MENFFDNKLRIFEYEIQKYMDKGSIKQKFIDKVAEDFYSIFNNCFANDARWNINYYIESEVKRVTLQIK